MTLLIVLILSLLSVISVAVVQRRQIRARPLAATKHAMRDVDPVAHSPIWETHEPVVVAPLKDLISWLDENRDPGLWYMLVRDLNYDLDVTFDTVGWILEQSDCPNAVATLAIKQAHWPEVYGMDDPPDWNGRVLKLLQIISDRDAAAGYPTDTLCDADGFDRSGLIDQCAVAVQKAQNEGITPILPLPYRTLSANPRGPHPQTDYQIDEAGVTQWIARA